MSEIKNVVKAAADTLQRADEQKVAIGLTVVDAGGHVVLQVRGQGANYMANEASYRKAKTSFLFQLPSHALRAITEKLPVLLEAIRQVPGDALMLEGGMPLKENGLTLGGVGVSGGNFEQDLMLVNFFVERLNTLQDTR